VRKAITDDQGTVIDAQVHSVAGQDKRLMGLPPAAQGSSSSDWVVQPVAATLGPRMIVDPWVVDYGRAYPESDFVRTGQLSIQIANRYVKGLRRTWKDGRHQHLENLIDEIATGIIAYGVALRLKEEERVRFLRNYERQLRVEQREIDREKRERSRQKILDELIAISTEARKLRTWLEEAKRWSGRSPSDDFARFVVWARNRLEHLDYAVDPDGIAESLKARELFPENDLLIDPPEDLAEE